MRKVVVLVLVSLIVMLTMPLMFTNVASASNCCYWPDNCMTGFTCENESGPVPPEVCCRELYGGTYLPEGECCDMVCVNTNTDPDNCGECGNDCDALDGWYCNGNLREYRDYNSCSGGVCQYTVTESYDCDNLDGWYCVGEASDLLWYEDWYCKEDVPGSAVCAFTKTQEIDCDDYDGYYCNGNIIEQRNYYCTGDPMSAYCDWVLLLTYANCDDLDGWYCKDDHTREYRDYYCTGPQPGAYCDYVVTQSEECDEDYWGCVDVNTRGLYHCTCVAGSFYWEVIETDPCPEGEVCKADEEGKNAYCDEVPEFPAGVTAVFGATLFIFLMMRRKYVER